MTSSSRLAPGQRRALAAVLDAIVPPCPDRGLPGAGELGVGEAIEENLREHPSLHAPLVEGLARLEARAAEVASHPFAEIDAGVRRAVLDAVSGELPAFLGPLLLQTYTVYYRHPRVLEALGLEGRPPHPEGYTLPPTDLSLLDPVRRRAPFYREP